MTWKFVLLFVVITVVSSGVNCYTGHFVNNIENGIKKYKAYANLKTIQLQNTCENVAGYSSASAYVEQVLHEFEVCTEGDLKPTEFCTIYSIQYKCFTELKNKIYSCMNDGYKSELTKTKKALQHVANQFCNTFNQSETLFLLNDGETCFRNNKKNFGSCGLDMIININTIPLESQENLKTFESEMCKVAESFDNCFIRSLQTCDNKVPGNIMDSLVNNLYEKEVYCENIPFAIYLGLAPLFTPSILISTQ